jgi:DNA-binding MarR family transcriptional regulator
MTDPPWLDEREERAWRGYRRMRTLLDLQIIRDLAADAALSDADYDVLSTLSETETHRLRLHELAGAIFWSNSRLSHHISRMEQRGLVAREGDARVCVIALTPAGLRTIQDAAPGHVTSVRRHFIDLLTPDQLDVLGDVAQAVITHLSSTNSTGEDRNDLGTC